MDEKYFKFAFDTTSFVEYGIPNYYPTGPPELMYNIWELTTGSDIWDVGVLALELIHKRISMSSHLKFERFLMHYVTFSDGNQLLKDFVRQCVTSQRL